MTRSAEVERAPGDAIEGLGAGGTWIELSVEADTEAVEVVSEILTRVAPGGVSVEPAFVPTQEGLGALVDPSRPAIVRAHLPALDAAYVQAAVQSVQEALGHLQAFELRPIGPLQTRVVHEEDWAHAWKRHIGVMRVGRRIVIRPSWRRHRGRPDDVVLALDPGMAFGTGLHPTTRLCLAGIEHWADLGLLGGGVRLLDLGCGSGILGIAAALLGAGRVVGIDPDPIAVDATRSNARRNHVARRVTATRGTLPSGRAPFDLVAANLVASLLVELAGPLAAEVRRGGRLIASGIFAPREDEVGGAFEHVGLRIVRRDTEGDWVALEASRIG